MGISSLSSTVATSFVWTAQNNLTGSQYNPVTQTGNIPKSQSNGTALGNTTSGGADEIFSFQQGIVAGSSATVDLNALTNILQQTSVAIVRIKAYQIRLLSGSDDSAITPTPTATSTITVTNNGATLPNPLDFATGGSGLTLALTTSTGAISGVAIGAAGTGYPKSATFQVIPVQASGSGGVVKVTTNSSGVPTSVGVDAAGSGYSDATVPSVVLGQYTILTGGTHMYFDPGATGFALVSTTQRNIKILNNDGSNAVTFELDVIGATT